MIENSKVMARIEYESEGLRRAYLGEIDRSKFDELRSEKENFICLTNDGGIALIDKEAILSFDEFETKLCVYAKHGMGPSSFATEKEIGIRSYLLSLKLLLR